MDMKYPDIYTIYHIEIENHLGCILLNSPVSGGQIDFILGSAPVTF